MNEEERSKQASAILAAIRAKREKRTAGVKDIDALEASLMEDIEKFDLDAMERQARLEAAKAGRGMSDPKLVFPTISTGGGERRQPGREKLATAAPANASTASAADTTPLLDQLRRQAASKQEEEQQAVTERVTHSEAIDKALRHVFFYLHELTQQLDVVKPEIPRTYRIGEGLEFSDLVWQQGFADYRTQPQSAGALVELVTFSFKLLGRGNLHAEREGSTAERFRTTLFDFGLQFNCKEFRSERGYLERAEFTIPCELAVNLRWRADYHQGLILLEAHNFERLGSAVYPIRPASVDQALLDAFGRLTLGQPNQFRELARRQ